MDELNKEITLGPRRARVDHNRCAEHDGNKPFAVFKHTYWRGWSYDGYVAFTTYDEAVTFRDNWLNQKV